MRALILTITILASAAAVAEEASWKLNLRTLALVDYFQTTEFVFRTPGIYEQNRILRGASHFQTGIYLAAEAEVAIWVVERFPKKHQPLASTLMTLFRALPVVGNSKLGASHNYSVYVPIVNAKF